MICISKLNDKHKKIAYYVSRIFDPPVISIIVFLIINYFQETTNFFTVEAISLAFGSIIPMVIMYMWMKHKGIDIDFTNMHNRRIPLFINACISFIGSYLLWIVHSNSLTFSLLICYGITSTVLCLVYYKWKISLHIISLTGAVISLLFISPYGFILGLTVPIVMWARLTLRKHDIKQLVVGSLYGYFVIALLTYYIIGSDINTLINIFWMILSLITPPIFLSLIGTFRKKGKVKNNNTKIIIIDTIIFILLFVAFSPNIAVLSFVLCVITSIIVAYLADDKFLWHRAIEIPL